MSANRIFLWVSTLIMIGVFAIATILSPNYWYIYVGLMLWSISVGISWKIEMMNELRKLDEQIKGKR